MFFNVPRRVLERISMEKIYTTPTLPLPPVAPQGDRLVETRRRGVTAAGSQPRQTTAFVFLARLYDFI